MGPFILKSVLALQIFVLCVSVYAEKISVHEFSVPPEMAARGQTGWWAAEYMESLLSRNPRFEVITRARIGQVIREQNLNAGAVVKNEPLRIAKADLVVSGRFVSNVRDLTITLSVIRSDSGAVYRSFQLSSPNVSGLETETLQRLLEDAAAFLAMSPGAMLEKALEYKTDGNFRRTQEIMTFLTLNFPLNSLDAENPPEGDPSLSGKSIAELFNTGIELWRKGERNKARLYLHAARARTGVRHFSDLLNEVKNALKKHDQEFGELLASARKEYEALVQKGKSRDALAACENEMRKLRDYIRHSDVKLLRNELRLLEEEIQRFQTFRSKIFAGPSSVSAWMLPELGIRLIPVSPGEFKPDGHEETEKSRRVRISRPYWISEKEISVGEYVVFLNSATVDLSKSERYRYDREIRYLDTHCPIDRTFSLRRGHAPDDPMSCVSWRGAKLYTDWLNERERKAGRLPPGYEYRLPTEGEWDWAARGGEAGKGKCLYCSEAAMKKIAVTRETAGGEMRKTGSREPNALGLYDMYGNLWEWCNDWYAETSSLKTETDPIGPENNADDCKVIRGGSFLSSAPGLNCGTRREADYRAGRSNIGFRIVCAPIL